MNIFYLDNSTMMAAQYHVDKHVNKMILETAQLLSTSHWYLDGAPRGYKPTHKNHPCAIWVRDNSNNYWWTYDLFCALAGEYKFRFGKDHKSYVDLKDVLNIRPKYLTDHGPMTSPPLAMPDEYKVEGSSTASYRNYYTNAKEHLHTWTKRERPEWMDYYVRLP